MLLLLPASKLRKDYQAIPLESANREQTTEQSANGIDLEDGFSQSQVRATLLLVGLQARR